MAYVVKLRWTIALLMVGLSAPCANATEPAPGMACKFSDISPNGPVELARIMKSVRGYRSLAKSEPLDDWAAAERDDLGIVVRRVGRYLCVRDASPNERGDYWVESRFTKPLPHRGTPIKSWEGIYQKAFSDSIEIKRVGARAFLVSGAATYGTYDGPRGPKGSGGTVSAQIGLERIVLSGNELAISSVTKDIFVDAGGRNTAVGNGTKDASCRPRLRVQGAILIVRDRPGCPQRSQFEGIWRRGEIWPRPNPRDNHAFGW